MTSRSVCITAISKTESGHLSAILRLNIELERRDYLLPLPDKLKLSFLLFDEIEKASDALWQLLLGILDKATLTLGDNRRVDLSQTVIFMTSNLGGTDITDLFAGGYGFVKSGDKPQDDIHQKVERTAVEAARRKFSPEFMNRIDKLVVFRPLKRDELQSVLDIELGMVQKRVLDTATGKFLFRVTDAGRDFLLREGTDQRYGARHLKRAIERFLVYPLANLLATQQVKVGDLVRVDWDGVHSELTFVREREGALITPVGAEPELLGVSPKADGLAQETPIETVAEETSRPAALPATSPATAPHPLQGRKKENR